MVEAGEDGPRPVGYQQRVQVVVPPVQGSVSREEADLHFVPALAQVAPVEMKVLAGISHRPFPSVDAKAAEPVASFPEIDGKVRPFAQEETQLFRSGDRCLPFGGDGEMQGVADAVNRLRTPLRQVQADTGGFRRDRAMAGDKQRKQERRQ